MTTLITEARERFEELIKSVELKQLPLNDAAEALTDLVVEDKVVWTQLARLIVRQAMYDKLRSRQQEIRRKVWTGPPKEPQERLKRSMLVEMTLYDFPLPHSTMPLRHAKKEDLLTGAEWYETRGADMLWKARWLRAVAAKVGRATVCQRLSPQQLKDLQEACHA